MKVADTPPDVRIVLIVEYDGTGYHGSQLQKNAPTVQREIEKALRKLTGDNIRVKAASRTDAGVHARGQVFSFKTKRGLPLRAFVHGMNHHLPRDIAVKKAFRVKDGFDVRRGALSREYRYCIVNSDTRSPVRDAFSYRVEGKLDVEAMRRACGLLAGRHDFASFVTGTDISKRSTVRNVHKAEIEQDGDMIILDMVADSFLPHQVRNTVGALIRVGQGNMTVAEFQRMFESRKPCLAKPTAPACGLCLMRVNYPEPWEIRDENL